MFFHTVKPIFHEKTGSCWVPNANEMYMPNANQTIAYPMQTIFHRQVYTYGSYRFDWSSTMGAAIVPQLRPLGEQATPFHGPPVISNQKHTVKLPIGLRPLLGSEYWYPRPEITLRNRVAKITLQVQAIPYGLGTLIAAYQSCGRTVTSTWVGSARLCGYQHVGIGNPNPPRWGSYPTRRSNANRLALRWNIGLTL